MSGDFIQRYGGGDKVAAFKPVVISKAGFIFCRSTIAVLLWLAIILLNIWLIVVTLLIMSLSAIFKVERAPLILLWKHTAERFLPGSAEVVDERGIFVSHVTGVVFAVLCLGLLCFSPAAGWIATVIFALLQTSAACGFCSALKLYGCLTGGNCCRFGRYAKRWKDKADHNAGHA